MRRIDIAILGGGPAGTDAALTLARYTERKVVLVEATNYSDPRVGETVSAALVPLLNYLDVPDNFRPPLLQSYSTAAAWGSDHLLARDSLFSGRGNGAHLDRRAFDYGLAEASVAAGAENLCGTHLRSLARHGNRICLQLPGAVCDTLEAQFVIDATGRRAAFARRLGATLWHTDDLTACVAYFLAPRPEGDKHDLVVEATEHGWWYATLLHENRIIAAFLSNGRVLRELGTALMSGIQAARVADEALIGGRALAEAYPMDLLRLRSDFAHQRNRFYRSEQRWPTSGFWAGLSKAGDGEYSSDES